MPSEPVLFVASYSVYVRSARLALHEKGVPYRLEPVDVFAAGGPPATYSNVIPSGAYPPWSMTASASTKPARSRDT